MSIGSLSDVVANKILVDLREKIDKEIKAGFISIVNGKIDIKDANKSIFGDLYRVSTNGLQDGIMTQDSLRGLQEEFNRAAGKSIDPVTGKPISVNAKKLIKFELSGYKQWPALYTALQAGRTTIEAEIEKAANLLATNNLFINFFNWYQQTYPQYNLDIFRDGNNISGFIAQGLEHAQFNKQFKQFLQSQGFNGLTIDFIDANTDAGHFLGIFNVKFAKLFDLDVTPGSSYNDITVTSATNRLSSDVADENILLENYKKMMQLLAEADYISSLLLSNIQVVSTTTRKIYGQFGEVSSIEIQLSKLNQRVGSKIGSIGRALRNVAVKAKTASSIEGSDTNFRTKDFKESIGKLFSSADVIGKYLEATSELYDKVLTDSLQKTVAKDIAARGKQIAQELIDAAGSDSILISIGKRIKHALNPKQSTLPRASETKVKNKFTPKVTAKKQKTFTVTVPKTNTAKATSKIKKRIKTNLSRVPNSLTSLENLLRLQLQQTVRQNMGTGDRRDILNLRSGRFANSVKIDRLTQSREGTITAFYNYMRYPYATFSRGGDQERPFTRDPKLLIAGSIRQIAQQVTTQRLRAVLV